MRMKGTQMSKTNPTFNILHFALSWFGNVTWGKHKDCNNTANQNVSMFKQGTIQQETDNQCSHTLNLPIEYVPKAKILVPICTYMEKNYLSI